MNRELSSLVVGETYRSEQNGFAWLFEVLGIGAHRVRVEQSSTAGGFTPRVRLLTVEQWRGFAPVKVVAG